ncbi:MAG: GAF domain-containing protein, partial [Thermomicrobium sp.]
MTSPTEQPAPEDLFRHVLRTLLPIVNADLGGFFVFDEDFEQVLLGAIEGTQPPGSLAPVGVARISPREVPAESWIRKHQRSLHLYRPRHWRRFPPVNPGLRELAMRGKLVALVIPLRSPDELVGVAYLWRHREPRPFLRREIRTAERWCQLAASAAIASRLYEREAQARQALARVLAIDRALATASSHDAVGRAVVGALADYLTVESLALWLRSGEEHKVFLHNIADQTIRETLTSWEFSWSHFEQLTSRPQVLARD